MSGASTFIRTDRHAFSSWGTASVSSRHVQLTQAIHLRVPLWLRNTGLNALDLGGAEAGGSPLMFGSGKLGSYGTLKLRDGGIGRRSPLTSGGRGSHGSG